MDRSSISHTRKRLLVLFLATMVAGLSHAGQQSPPWQAEAASGTVQIPDAEHELTIILFWASWCPYCKQLMPHLQSILDQYPDHSIRVLAPTIKEDGDPAAYLEERGYEFDLILEGDPIAARYMIVTTPGVILVNGEGDILFDLRTVRPQQPAVDDSSPHWRKAARLAPYWSARLRQVIAEQFDHD